MELLDKIAESIRTSARTRKELDFKRCVAAASMRDRQRSVSSADGAELIQRLKRRPRYRINPSSVSDPTSDPYTVNFIITQIKGKYRKESEPTLDIGEVSDDYNVFVNDSSISNPFMISSELARIIKRHTKNLQSKEEKARAIFDWIEQNIEYGDSRKLYGYSNTKEVLENREGICGEMAFLYITMARSVNLRSSYVSVGRDCYGKRVHHACAVVDVGSRDVLVDPAYHAYDVQHKAFEILTDAQVIERFNQWR